MKTNTKNASAQSVAHYYISHARRYPKYFFGMVLAIPVTVLLNGFLPTLILASVLSRLSQGDFEAGNIWSSFGPELIAYAALLIAGNFAWRLVDRLMWNLEMNVERDLADEVFDKLLRQSADFHANNFSGSLVSQNSKLLNGYVRIADTTIFQVYPMLVSIVFAIVIMAVRAPLFAALLLVFSLVYLALAFRVSLPVRKAGQTYANAESAQTGFLADAITNSMAIKSFATGGYERKRFGEATAHSAQLLHKLSKANQKQMSLLGLSSRTISGISLFIAVISVMSFKANIGTVFLILSYTSTIVEQLFQFGNASLRNYNRVLGDSREIVDTLALTPTIVDPAKPQPSQMNRGNVAFEHVNFTHDGSDDALFDNFSLHIKPGKKVGLVGHSGSGKTTFTRLLMRFSDIQGGRITIDGQDITTVTQDDLHQAIAYVPQEPLLFHRTISENIAYGRGDNSPKAVKRVARMAHAAEFIDQLPQGYDTLVGERGVKLSGGQRQRVAIARAMLKNAPIILLDEATSALDSESEVLIQSALWKLMEGRTAIVIAHRLSTIQKMDRIVVLDEGRIVEQGSHTELLEQNGTYAKLWAHQSGGFMED